MIDDQILKNMLFRYISIFLLLFGCNENEEIVIFKIGDKFNLDYQQLGTSEDNNISIRIDQVFDSRCPTSVTCITEGGVTIELSALDKKSNSQAEKVQLTIVLGAKKLYATENFSIELIDVLPYPKEPGDYKNHQYTFEFIIREL